MSKVYLCTIESNWADEMDIAGFRILKEAELITFMTAAQQCNRYGDYEMWYMGSNQSVGWASYKDFRSEFDIREITDEEAETLLKMFGCKFGYFPNIDVFESWDEEDDEYEGVSDSVFEFQRDF